MTLSFAVSTTTSWWIAMGTFSGSGSTTTAEEQTKSDKNETAASTFIFQQEKDLEGLKYVSDE